MDFLSDLGKKISVTAKNVTKKSEDIIEITKLNLAASNEEDKIKKMLYEIGSDLYQHFTNGVNMGDYFNGKCAEVKETEENITKLKEKALKLKGSKVCKACDAVIGYDVNFCPICGAKAEVPATDEILETDAIADEEAADEVVVSEEETKE